MRASGFGILHSLARLCAARGLQMKRILKVVCVKCGRHVSVNHAHLRDKSRDWRLVVLLLGLAALIAYLVKA